MSETRKPAAQSLLETGTLVLFRVVDTHTELSPDKENVFVRADLAFEDDDDDTCNQGNMNTQFDRITIDTERMNGRPCIRGIRLTARRVVEAAALYRDRLELKQEYR